MRIGDNYADKAHCYHRLLSTVKYELSSLRLKLPTFLLPVVPNIPSVQQYLVKRKEWFLNYRDVVEQTLDTYTLTMTSLVPDLR